ncbi:TRAP transporter substrate-binding protein DctP [Thermodesulfobacteriota bacterium]
MTTSPSKYTFLFALILSLLFAPSTIHAKPKYLFKIASLAPAGSVWAQRFDDFSREVLEKTNGEVGFKVYPGGVMGNELAVYRKMRIGQLQGGGFTMSGISEVVDDFRIMGLPFLFDSYEEVDWVKKGLWPHFKKAFAEKGMVLIAMTEVGFVYAMSTWPITSLGDMQKSKTWLPEGDKISPAYLKTAGVSGTVLSIPDVLTSLQTGLIDTVFNSFYGTIVMQWFTQAKYISDIPFGYAYGAFLVSNKKFSRLPATYRSLIESSAQKHFEILMRDTRTSNREALDVLKKNGVQMVTVDATSIEKLHSFRLESVKGIIGTAFSRSIYNETLKHLDTYRSQSKQSQFSNPQNGFVGALVPSENN